MSGILVSLYIQPGAKMPGFAGHHGGLPKIKISAQAQDGKANEDLIAFLSKHLKIPKRDFTIVAGEHHRLKKIFIDRLVTIPPELLPFL
jgi:uncharacterized protein (TIGR00251 family)